MNRELFGVVGDRTSFGRLRVERAFDEVVDGETLTVGVRDPATGIPGRTDCHADERGFCVVWGECTLPSSEGSAGVAVARRLLDRYETEGRTALARLDGSYLACIDCGGEALVATDPIRSWECFHGELDGVHAFGSALASFARLRSRPTVDDRALAEYLLLGTVLDERTLLDSVGRLPFDGYLTPDGTGEFTRFVHESRDDADHAAELATALERALDRRTGYPGRTGVLLGSGEGSRTLLARDIDVDRCFTFGAPDTSAIAVARRVAEQYGVDHAVLTPDDRRPIVDDGLLTYTQGIKGAGHLRAAGYDAALDVDTLYHGFMFDTLFAGQFLPRARATVGGASLPRRTLADVDPVEWLLDAFGFTPAIAGRLADCAPRVLPDVPGVAAALEDAVDRVSRRVYAEFEACRERADSTHDAIDLFAVRNLPATPFRTHLADAYLESFVAADGDLLAWHLRTPAAERNRATLSRAVRRLDGDLLRHRPPGRPYDVPLLNGVDRRLRRRLPIVDDPTVVTPGSWEREQDAALDARLPPIGCPIDALPPRQRLRLRGVHWWLDPRSAP